MLDFFPTMNMKPNESCDEYHCRNKQKEFAKELAARPKVRQLKLYLGNVKRGISFNVLFDYWNIQNKNYLTKSIFTKKIINQKLSFAPYIYLYIFKNKIESKFFKNACLILQFPKIAQNYKRIND